MSLLHVNMRKTQDAPGLLQQPWLLHWPSETWLQSMPAQPCCPSRDSLSSHLNPQGLSGAPLAPHLPSSHSGCRGSSQKHPNLNPPQPSASSPRFFMEIPKGPNSGAAQLQSSFPFSAQTWENACSRDIQVGRRRLPGVSERLDFGDQVLNCCPLLMLNSQQSALRSAIITIHKNSPFVSRA